MMNDGEFVILSPDELKQLVERCENISASPYIPDDEKPKHPIVFLKRALANDGRMTKAQYNAMLQILDATDELIELQREIVEKNERLRAIKDGKIDPNKPQMTQQHVLFNMKNAQLKQICGDPVEPFEFYREMFPVGSFERKGQPTDEKPNGIAMEIRGDGKRNFSTLIFDDLTELLQLSNERDFVITSPIAYIGNRRNAENARLIFGICIDLDGVGKKQLTDLFFQIQNGILPEPTFIANSGHGLHLYFNFERPVKAYRKTTEYLHKLKYGLIECVWNAYTSTLKNRQLQGIFQGFRAVGSPSKLGRDYPVTAYRYGKPVTIEYLNEFVSDEYQLTEYTEQNEFTLSECAELFPEWFERRIVRGMPPKTWKVNRAVYDNWKKRIAKEAKTGHRYFCIMTLAIYARKCGIDFDELQSDALEFLEPFNGISTDNPFTIDDIKSALKAFDVPHYVRTSKKQITRWTTIQIKTNRRNGRSQSEHLKRARAVQSADDPTAKWRNMNGAPTAKTKVEQWQKENPNGTKTACANALKISRTTVTKWWVVEA